MLDGSRITPEDLASLQSFEDLALLFHQKLGWPAEDWPTFIGVADLYEIAKEQIPGVERLAAVQKLDDTQSWGIFLVDFGANSLKRNALRGILSRVAERARQQHDNPTWPHENILFVVRSTERGSPHWTLGQFSGKLAQAHLKRFDWSGVDDARTAAESVMKLRWGSDWTQAWDVERLQQAFFDELLLRFQEIEALWNPSFDPEQRRSATQLLVNRLLFICFLQRKGWLEFNGSRPDYLFSLYDGTDVSDLDADTFSRRLEVLFFSGLNTPNRTPGDRGELEHEIGRVPFLNGGLFERSHMLDSQRLPNRAYTRLLGRGGLFRSYNFTIEESTPLDVDVAVDPEMLGKVFEELITKRHDTGSYYTPRPIVSFMCREALKGYLGGYEALVDDHDVSGIKVQDARELLRKLESVTFCDPACGSGAYLVGMLQEIFALQRLLDTAGHLDRQDYARKKVVIENCLYGVDYEPFAVSIAWLRLWLTLVIDNPANPLDEPDADVALPNLDLKLEAGDSVASADPTAALIQTVSKGRAQQGFDYEGVDELIEQYIAKRKQYQPAHGPDKIAIFEEIAEIKARIKDRVATTGFSARAFLWAIEFPEIFLSDDSGFIKGFDIVLANPPYVRHEAIKQQHGDAYKKQLAASYPNTGSGTADLYVYFYDRGMQLLKPGGMFVYISSNKWFKAGYGAKLRKHLTNTTQIHSITDFGELPVFKNAATFPMIFLAQKAHDPPVPRQSPTFTQVKSLDAPYPDVKALVESGGFTLPDDAIQGETWTLADAEALRRIRVMSAGMPLRRYVNEGIYSGVKTGFNDAFIIDGPKRAELIAQDPICAEIIKPLAIGDDVRKWRIRQEDRWLIFTRRGIEIEHYPAIKNHLEGFRVNLEPRPTDWKPTPDQPKWPGRKEGRYKWYEIQDDIAYYADFDAPKVVYPEMALSQRFSYDTKGTFTNNKAFIIPVESPFLVGILNSIQAWKWLSLTCSVLGDSDDGGRLELRSIYLERLPIPTASDVDHNAIVIRVEEILDLCDRLAAQDEPVVREGAALRQGNTLTLTITEHLFLNDSPSPTSAPSELSTAEMEARIRDLEDEIDRRVEFLYFHQGEAATYDEWVAKRMAEEGTLVGEVRKMIEVDETDEVEFKETLEYVDRPPTGVPKDALNEWRTKKQAERIHEVLKTICGFVNTNGGTLLIGVHNDRSVTGIEPDFSLFSSAKDRGVDGFERKVRDLCDRRLNRRPIGLLRFNFPVLDGKTVCRIDVTANKEPFYLDNDYWIRDGNRTITLIDHERDAYIANRRIKLGE